MRLGNKLLIPHSHAYPSLLLLSLFFSSLPCMAQMEFVEAGFLWLDALLNPCLIPSKVIFLHGQKYFSEKQTLLNMMMIHIYNHQILSRQGYTQTCMCVYVHVHTHLISIHQIHSQCLVQLEVIAKDSCFKNHTEVLPKMGRDFKKYYKYFSKKNLLFILKVNVVTDIIQSNNKAQ